MSESKRSVAWATFACAYVIAVLGIDTLATHRAEFLIDWSVLRGDLHGIDVFKFAAWFVVPFLVCLPRMDWGYLTFVRWKRVDWILLGSVAAVGGVIMLILPYLPGVGELYRGWAGRPMDQRIDFATRQVLWTLSWLTGWEFMHRYLLPRTVLAAWPQRGWILLLITVPLIEALYHVVQNKPPLECLGVAAMSLAFTLWVVRRRNALLPFLGHLIIELELIAFLFFTN